MSQHTPGPWTFETLADRVQDIEVYGGEAGVHVATVTSENADRQQTVIADARLIAAAPALLEALSETERLAAVMIGRFHAACEGRHFEGRTCDYCLVDDILRTARAALALATGKDHRGVSQGLDSKDGGE